MDVIKTVLAIFVFTFILSIGDNAAVVGSVDSEATNRSGVTWLGVRDCTLSIAGHEYIGHTSVTVSGKNCQAWAVQTPHQHEYNQDQMFPDGSVTGASNYCRNPDSGWLGLWCYTKDPDVRWESCDVPTCACKLEPEASTYRGLMRSTISGKMCQHWSEQSPHQHSYTNASTFADGNIEKADNFCRNPDPEFTDGAWCYTMDDDTRWEMCDVPLCSPRNASSSLGGRVATQH